MPEKVVISGFLLCAGGLITICCAEHKPKIKTLGVIALAAGMGLIMVGSFFVLLLGGP